MNTAYLLMGGNIGDREGFLAAARKLVAARCGLIRHRSSLYQTAAWGLEQQDAFLNQALEIYTPHTAAGLLETVLAIEKELGRIRAQRYGPRIVDIDILLYNDEIVNAPHLSIPHPQLPNRRFALVPLAEIAPAYRHPLLQKTVRQLLEECTDPLDVYKIS